MSGRTTPPALFLYGLDDGSRELGVEVVEDRAPDVDDQRRLGLVEKGDTGMRHARLVPDGEQPTAGWSGILHT
jgi:hypothetical protein